MNSIKSRLEEAADYLDHLYEGSKHIPTDLFHPEDERGIVLSMSPSAHKPVAQFFWGGATEVFLALGPVALPLLSRLLRTEAAGSAGDEIHDARCVPEECTGVAAVALADHILKAKESQP